MINMREIDEAIKDLLNGSATYNNCMKLASLYIIRDHMMQPDQRGNYTYANNGGNYGYRPMYERGGRSGNSGSSSYHYYDPMYYNQDELLIKKDMQHDMML